MKVQASREVLMPHLHFSSVIANASFYLLWNASCDLKPEEGNSLQHGSVQLSKQSNSRAEGTDGKTPTVASIVLHLSIRSTWWEKKYCNKKEGEGMDQHYLKQGWTWAIYLTLPAMREMPCQTLPASILHGEAIGVTPLLLPASCHTFQEKSLFSHSSAHVNPLAFYYRTLSHVLHFSATHFSHFFTPQNSNIDNTPLKWY